MAGRIASAAASKQNVIAVTWQRNASDVTARVTNGSGLRLKQVRFLHESRQVDLSLTPSLKIPDGPDEHQSGIGCVVSS